MVSQLSTVMYHYVRPIMGSDFPELKGRDLQEFCHQLDYLEEHYNFVTVEEINHTIKTGSKLRQNACWLTFDDGYRDHFDYVFPILQERGIQGAFFPPSRAILCRELLDVNAVHFILAGGNPVTELLEVMEQECLRYGTTAKELHELKELYCKPNRWDAGEVIYFKRMLQQALKPELRKKIIRTLLETAIGTSSEELAERLYMSKTELQTLVKKGMYVGSHGAKHIWLDKASSEQQSSDIKESLELLEEISAPLDDWVMCYPYGSYDGKCIEILKSLSCSIGITTRPATAYLGIDSQFELPRLDTNDFPYQ